MANVRYGQGIVDIRGSIAGNVFSRSTGGAHISAAQRRIKHCTSSQKEVRKSFAQCRNSWTNDITPNQKEQWNIYAGRKPEHNRLGEQIYRTGWNWFLRFNTLRYRNGLGPITIPPLD